MGLWAVFVYPFPETTPSYPMVSEVRARRPIFPEALYSGYQTILYYTFKIPDLGIPANMSENKTS